MKYWKVYIFLIITAQLLCSCFQVYEPISVNPEISGPFSEGSEVEQNGANSEESKYKDKIFTEEPDIPAPFVSELLVL